MTRAARIAMGIIVAALSFLADQASKQYFLAKLIAYEPGHIEVTPFFNLVMVWNRGISFGMFEQNQPHILVALSLVICLILLRWLVKNNSTLVAAAIGLIIGGAMGNVVDRLHYGAVADFFDFHAGNLHWPAFNIADSTVFIGVVLLIVNSMVFERKNPKDHP